MSRCYFRVAGPVVNTEQAEQTLTCTLTSVTLGPKKTSVTVRALNTQT